MFDANPDDPVPKCSASTALQQHVSFASALQAYGQNPIWITQDTPVLVMRRRVAGVPIALISRAVIRDPYQLAVQLKQAGMGRHVLLLSPETPSPDLAQTGAVPLMTPGHIAQIDLRESQDKRRANLHQKWRNRLLFSQRQNLRVRRQNLPPKADHWLLKADALQQARRGYCHWPPALTLAFARETPSAAKLFTAFEGRDPVAAMLFLRHGPGATYHIGHSTARGRALCAHNLLLWQASGWLAAQGHQSLELGLIDTANAPGLARFKLGAAAKAHRLGGTWAWWPPLGRVLHPFAALDRQTM